MRLSLSRLTAVLLIAGLAAALMSQSARAYPVSAANGAPAASSGMTCALLCPFCAAESQPTLIAQYRDATMVLYGYFTDPKKDASGGTDNGTSNFVIEQVLKPNDIVKGKKEIRLGKYILPSKSKWIIFCSVYKDVINPYQGEEILPGSEMLQYMTSALKVMDQPEPKRLRHCFDFLNSADIGVSTDAYREFAIADYTEYKEMARSLPAKTIAAWLADPKTPSFRYGLYASLLGHCGDPKVDGDLLRSMLDDPIKLQGANIDGIMAGYAMLQPKEAHDFFQKLLKNGKEEFQIRYAVMRTLRFLWDYRTDVLSKEQLLKTMGQAIDVADQSDFAIDDLRTWKAWDMTDKVLDLFTKDSHNHTFVKRAILRFALSSPSPRAVEFVRQQRLLDASWVSDTEELLRIEAPAEKTADTKKGK